MKPKVRNWEVAVYAVHVLGGISNHVGTEDIALKCFSLAPDSFSWVKYTEYPDKDIVRAALSDARKEKYGGLLTGRAGAGRGQAVRSSVGPRLDGWMLTEAGVLWVGENKERIEEELGSRELSSHRQEQLQKLARVREHRLFQWYLDQPEGFTPSLGDMADLFRCRVDADHLTWQKRFQAATNIALAANDAAVVDFVKKCRASLEQQLER